MACHVQPPKQVPVNLDKEVVGLNDIPLTNMPGHAPPEVPLECICPKMFGLDHNPCCPPKAPHRFVWHKTLYNAMMDADGNKLILVFFRRNKTDADSLLSQLDNSRAKKVLDKHYVGLLLEKEDEEVYRTLRTTSTQTLKWLPGDFVGSPSVLIMKTSRKLFHGGSLVTAWKLNTNTIVVLAAALPISFDTHVNADMSDLLRKYYKASKSL